MITVTKPSVNDGLMLSESIMVWIERLNKIPDVYLEICTNDKGDMLVWVMDVRKLRNIDF